MIVEYEHRVVGVSRADQVGQREILGRKVQLELVRERHFRLEVASGSASFEKERTFLGLDYDLRSTARTGGEWSDPLDNAKVVVTKAGCQEFGLKCRVYFRHNVICPQAAQPAARMVASLEKISKHEFRNYRL